MAAATASPVTAARSDVQAGLVSIVVPALNEAENLPLLAERIDAAMSGTPYELLIVDDQSTDDTAALCGRLAERFPLRLIVREHRQAGLSGAVLHGFSLARGDTFLVIDADLQHPPEKIPELLAALRGGADFALGSRYVPGGATRVEWGFFRRLNSRLATLIAQPFAHGVRDPMSGFFALPRAVFDRSERLAPTGYKIALELISKCHVTKLVEVPIEFGLRQHGQSKLTFREQLRYLNHASRLYDFHFPRLSPIAKFLIAVAMSWTVAGIVAWVLLKSGQAVPAVAATSYPLAIGTTALLHYSYIQRQREHIIRPKPWRDFWLIALGEWATCAAASLWISHYAGQTMHVGQQLLFAFGCATVMRYILRKELLQDIRGLRRDLRHWDLS
ncbi:MAG: polyprenol monophosphomannose synthase [Tepidisphaeraceae bacterium]